jgi:hypothetical protein
MADTLVQDLPLREPTLTEELASLGEEDIFEMVNLREQDTGVAGTLFVSTALGAHGPRVKFYLKPGRDQPSFSVSLTDPPRVLASSLPVRELNRFAPAVIAWVKLNREDLLRFWNEGQTWDVRELAAFVAELKKV